MSARYTISIENSEQSFTQEADDVVLRAGLRAGLGYPYECNSGGCANCRFTLVEGDVEVLWEDAPGRNSRDVERGVYLGCQTRAKSDLLVQLRFGPKFVPKHAPKRTSARLTGVKALTHDISEFTLAAPGEAQFLPGQYALFEIGGHRRAYSMSNLPNAEGQWQFQIKKKPGGALSEILFGLEEGAEIAIDGPYGMAFLRPESERDVLCIAGGSGLSPMVSIARAIGLDDAQANKKLQFFYGCRTPDDVCGEDYLSDLPGYGEHIAYHPVISETDDPASAGWQGAKGFVHEAVEAALGDSLPEYEIYFAGPPVMAEAVQKMLVMERKVPFDQVHFDRFY